MPYASDFFLSQWLGDIATRDSLNAGLTKNRQVIRELFGDDIAIVDGDHFGSVAAGLGGWAERVFA